MKFEDKYRSNWDKIMSAGKNIFKATGDTGNLMGAAIAKAPAFGVDLANEIGKVVATGATGERQGENVIDKYSDKYKDLVNKQAKGQMQTGAGKENYEALQTGADILTPGVAITKLGKIPAVVEKVTSKSKKIETFVEKSNKAFAAFISKDKKIKKLTTEIKDLTKRFEKTKKNLTPEQIILMEKHIAEKQGAINALVSKGKTKVAADMKKKLKIDKDIDKIVNPTPVKDFAKKTAIGAGAVGAVGVAKGVLDGDEEEVKAEVVDGEDIPLPEGVESDAGEIGDQTLDTTGEEKNTGTEVVPADDGSTIAEDKDLTDAVNNEPTSTAGVIQTGGSVMDRQGNSYPVFLQSGSFKVTGPDGKTYTLIDGVTNANKKQKYAIASTRALPF